MAKEATCPVCNAYIPIDPGLKEGEFVYCSYCNARLRITSEILDEEGNPSGEADVEEDWDL